MIALILWGKRSLRFLLTPAGKVFMLVLALSVWTMYQRVDAITGCENSALAEELRETKRQIEIARQIASRATERADLTAAEMVVLEDQNEELKAEINHGEISSCPIPDDVRERLLRIR